MALTSSSNAYSTAGRQPARALDPKPLLDLEDPTRILGQLREPLLSPAADEQDGYVPNVVYSCDGFAHGGTLVLPYGISDAAIGVTTAPLREVLAALET